MNYTKLILTTETRYYRDLFHMLLGFIVFELLAIVLWYMILWNTK